MAKTNKRILITLWVTAFLLNLVLLYLYYHNHGERGLVGDEHGYIWQAREIAAGRLVGRGPLWPPGYGFFLAFPIFVSNNLDCFNQHPYLLAQLLQVLLWIACGLIFSSIANETLSSCRSRLMAIGLFLMYPTTIAYSHYFWPEIPHLAFFLAALWIVIKKPPTLVWSICLGASLAMTVLMKLVYLPISFILMLFPIVRSYKQRCIGHKVSAVFAFLTFFLLLAPVCYLNYHTHGKYMVADSSVFNAWVGLNDKELSDWNPNEIVGKEYNEFMRAASSHNERNNIYIDKIKLYISENGVMHTLYSQMSRQYYRLFNYRTYFINLLPRYPFYNKYLHWALRLVDGFIWAAILFGLGIGFTVTITKSKSLLSITWIHLFVIIIIYNIVLYTVLHIKTRYIIAFFPMLCIISALGWENLVIRIRQPWQNAAECQSYGVIVVGMLISFGLLYLGFHEILILN